MSQTFPSSWTESHEYSYQWGGSRSIDGKVYTHTITKTPSTKALEDLVKLSKGRQITKEFPYTSEKAVDREISKLYTKIKQLEAMKVQMKKKLHQTCVHKKWKYSKSNGDFMHFSRRCLNCNVLQYDYGEEGVKTETSS